MASGFQLDRTATDQDDVRTVVPNDGVPHELLGPVVAGAFARGVVDTFGLLGIAALFLDGEGYVLSVTKAAETRLTGNLTVQAGHLLAASHKDNRLLADFIAAALRDPAARPTLALGSSHITLRALPSPWDGSKADQLLQAIVVMEDAGARGG